MAKKKITVISELDNKDSIKSIKQMESELNTMKDTLSEIKDTGSKEFKALAAEITQADSKLKNLNKSFEGLDSEARAGELGKIAGGLGAMGTAAALAFGENETAEKFFKTFATGLAITNAVKGGIETYTASVKLLSQTQILQNAATKAAGIAQAAYSLAVGTSTGAMKLFRLALIGTGIGAIVVGLGLLIANFDKVSAAVSSAVDWVRDLGPVWDDPHESQSLRPWDDPHESQPAPARAEPAPACGSRRVSGERGGAGRSAPLATVRPPRWSSVFRISSQSF